MTRITTKEVFEQVIELRTKVDISYDFQKQTRTMFRRFVFLLVVLTVINILVHAVGVFL